MSDLVIILTTMPDDHRAEELARTLVDERLAACVNVGGPMVSTYQWKGQIETASERQLTIKTTRARLPDLEARVRALNPNELPEWLILDADASEAYAGWLNDATRSASG
jgi:periplasmic divalent cation tolerance protein